MIISNTDNSYSKVLATLLENQSWQSPLHTQSALNYYRQRPEDEGKTIQDQSFILVWENEPVVAFLGATVKEEKRRNLLAYEAPCIVIENKAKLTTKAAKSFLKKFDQMTENINGSIWCRDFLIDGDLSSLSKHLLNKVARTKPVFFQIIDLNNDTSSMKSNIRKSYKSLINWGIRELQPKVFDATNITWELMDEFRQLHIHEAGRETRSVDSWRQQFNMVKAGDAFVVFGSNKDKLVSAGLFMHSKTNCYYGVSASRRDLFEKPMFHSLMWTAVLHGKELGCKWFEVGEQLYPNHPHENPPTQKELGISEFKAGFGGETKMFIDLKLDCEELQYG